MRILFVLAWKDLLLRSRERVGLFWTFAFPLAVALFFGAMFGGGQESRPIAVAVIDEDGTPVSQAFVKRLSESEALKVQDLDLSEARDAVRRGKLGAFVRIKPGYGRASFFASDAAVLEVGIDPAHKAETGALQGVLMESAFRGMQEQFADPKEFQGRMKEMLKQIDQGKGELKEKDRKLLKQFLEDAIRFSSTFDPEQFKMGQDRTPIRLDVVPITPAESMPKTPYEITFPSSMMWAVLGCVMSFALSIVMERNSGTWLRLRISPLSKAQLLGGKALASFLGCLLATSMLLLAGRLIFGVRIENVAGMVLALACVAFAFTAIMMLLAALFRSEQALTGSGWGILMVCAFVGGGSFPLAFMPGWMQTISNVSPVKWGILAFEGAIWRGFSLTEMLYPCGILVGIGVVCFWTGVATLSRNEA
jgi:ABC-2 type transport system permease protein